MPFNFGGITAESFTRRLKQAVNVVEEVGEAVDAVANAVEDKQPVNQGPSRQEMMEKLYSQDAMIASLENDYKELSDNYSQQLKILEEAIKNTSSRRGSVANGENTESQVMLQMQLEQKQKQLEALMVQKDERIRALSPAIAHVPLKKKKLKKKQNQSVSAPTAGRSGELPPRWK